MDKIILLGYMGSGKTIIAKLLAQKIDFPFKDLDQLIENEENLSVSEIFTQKGEIAFRKSENLILKSLMASEERFVLAFGGGTPCYFNNHEMMQGKGILSVYLRTSIAGLYERLINEKEQRPMIAAMPNSEIKEFIAKHLFERSYFYNKASFAIDTDGKTPEVIAAEIEKRLV